MQSYDNYSRTIQYHAVVSGTAKEPLEFYVQFMVMNELETSLMGTTIITILFTYISMLCVNLFSNTPPPHRFVKINIWLQHASIDTQRWLDEWLFFRIRNLLWFYLHSWVDNRSSRWQPTDYNMFIYLNRPTNKSIIDSV